ncbi:penicillin-binding transpeptidase domain-containing protein [Catenuloplanes atrovinosus]|uniref:Cell division protein FtsI/penicillin-binding protein 2 n=1 Tax=Catenuloplanes atrovinosus TaxID=137266 RepID=A0AAE3YWP5_9ACTN|nr:penicillin-binding transpeptidase domain-containing protein [Catenuloplanes atrovinosus]MDR7281135.1 cell division protein FtsI/penicillin-binding protein 2 [Catenuloplanes atrovinosus]
MLRLRATAVTMLLLAGASLTACSGSNGAADALNAFLAGWRAGNLDGVGVVSAAGQTMAPAEVVTAIQTLSGELKDTPPELSAPEPAEEDTLATGDVKVSWTLPGGHLWEYQTPVRLTRGDDGWRVIWQPAVVHPQLKDGEELRVQRLTGTRAAIMDGTGAPIFTDRKIIVVGLHPKLATDLDETVATFGAELKQFGVDVSGLKAEVEAAEPDSEVIVATLRDTDYEKIRANVENLPGLVTRQETRMLAPTRVFARALLGTVGDVTKEDMDANPGQFEIGDQVGHGGLQERYDKQLRGTPGEAVLITQTTPSGEPTFTEVWRAEPGAGTPVKTTLDPKIQTAADDAVGKETKRTALVAIRISDGAIVAAANGPNGGAENLAFTAQVPPGSTYKMVAALGLLDANAVGLDSPVACPKTYTVEGREFKNAYDLELGTVPFRTDFARSCNTAFAALSSKLGAPGLASASAQLGIGGTWDVGAEAYTGKPSTGTPAAELAAASFGQGTTVVSPLAMAAATAAVARGSFIGPKLVVDPAPAGSPAPAAPLKETSVAALKAMMREVVTNGTGTDLKSVKGDPVYGKTGTAEYDSADPEKTHGWFVGWRGDIAVAAFVEGGGSGVGAAVPVVKSFYSAL